MYKGIDISHYDPQVDWTKTKAQGIDFVYIKCTQGTGFVDPLCVKHAAGAKSVSIKVGYYHFAAVEQDCVKQAQFFIAQFEKLPKAELLPVLDLETNKANLNRSQIHSFITTFQAELKKAGYGMMLYSYEPFLDTNLDLNHGLGTIPLWLAQYRNVDAPTLPHGWMNASVWQYTDSGHIDGISAIKVDMNKGLNDDFLVE